MGREDAINICYTKKKGRGMSFWHEINRFRLNLHPGNRRGKVKEVAPDPEGQDGEYLVTIDRVPKHDAHNILPAEVTLTIPVELYNLLGGIETGEGIAWTLF